MSSPCLVMLAPCTNMHRLSPRRTDSHALRNSSMQMRSNAQLSKPKANTRKQAGFLASEKCGAFASLHAPQMYIKACGIAMGCFASVERPPQEEEPRKPGMLTSRLMQAPRSPHAKSDMKPGQHVTRLRQHSCMARPELRACVSTHACAAGVGRPAAEAGVLSMRHI